MKKNQRHFFNMELDFATVKALSSPTRIEILSKLLQKESTPTRLSDDIDRTKSTVSSHLDTLVNAGLVEKDEEAGRKRVVYRPTKKAEAIVNGRERKVRFSLASAGLSAFAGTVLVGDNLLSGGAEYAAQRSGDMGAMSMETEAAKSAADTASQAAAVSPETVALTAGAMFFLIAIAAFMYGLAMRKIG
ncbi:MAG: ArsR/SmtB family transcription factor [Candidatus Nanohaloarchaea archaeon]